MPPKNAPTGVPARPRSDHDLIVYAGRGEEAEGFEPPVPLGTLAFKAVDRLISGDRPSNMGRP
jgi:hypothetical protein